MRHFESVVEQQRDFFQNGKTMDYGARIARLNKLQIMLIENESTILDALYQDLHKSEHESFTTECSLVYSELKLAKKKLRKWMRHKKARTPLTHIGSNSFIIPEPHGVVAIFSPWNYPFQLAIAPLISAIAAGNCVVLKLSEHSPYTSEILAHLIRKTFDPAVISVILGNGQVAEALLKERFDYIFFTGNGSIGKKVMKQASEHLTPVTLELGGKSPVIVDKDVNIGQAAKRIVWGKFTNAGQTCVAPDHVYVHESIRDSFVEMVIKQIKALYTTDPLSNKDYGRLIHQGHFERIQSMLSSGDMIYGGKTDQETLRIEPTLMENISHGSPLLTEEIFGPILPIFVYSELPTLVQILKTQEKPLACYVFSSNDKHIAYIQQHLSFGGGCINDTLYHVANTHLPFGGVGASGMGTYHGKHGFDTFSHMKSIVRQTTLFDLPFRYPTGKKWLAVMKKLFK